MNLTEQQKSGQELLSILITKSWENEEFKGNLINCPNETINNINGFKDSVSWNTKIIVEDQTDTSKVFINIPRKLELSDMQLSDEQLETVSGGDVILAGVLIGLLAASAVYGISYAVGSMN